MLKKFLFVCFCTVFCLGVVILGCKKGCPTCKSYGYSSGANETYQGSAQPTVQGPIYQVCLNNSCTCPNGQEGDSCQIYSVNKYILPSPNWQASDPCTAAAGGSPNYSVYMTSNPPNYTYFYMNNLFNLGAQTIAQIGSTANNTGNFINIPSQTVGGISYSGQGTYQVSGNLGKLILNLDYNQNGIDQNCIITMYQTL